MPPVPGCVKSQRVVIMDAASTTGVDVANRSKGICMIPGVAHRRQFAQLSEQEVLALAMLVVFVELWAIAWVQNRYVETPFLRAALQVVLGGALVFAAGIFIGSA